MNNIDTTQNNNKLEEPYENAEALTANGKPKWFDRGKTLTIIAIAFVFIIMAGFIFNPKKSKKSGDEAQDNSQSAHVNTSFLDQELSRSLNKNAEKESGVDAGQDGEQQPAAPPAPPSVPFTEIDIHANRPASMQTAPPSAPNYSGSAPNDTATPTPHNSPLIANIEGSLWNGNAGRAPQNSNQSPYANNAQGQNTQAAPPPRGAAAIDAYNAQNNQDNKIQFAQPNKNIAADTGTFNANNAIWVGTVIPAILQTAINTDLPGNVIARVTSNVYSSRTGFYLLIPQGSLLVAHYNSSISYAQHRVQIAWDTLIRPDGYEIDLGGMNGIDRRGMAGQEGDIHENYFEYLKAAGIIAMFSIANSKMTEDVAKYGNDNMAAGIAQSNASVGAQLGQSIIQRVLNIQPTLTVDAGEKVNIMTNRTIYLPPTQDYNVTQKYIRQ